MEIQCQIYAERALLKVILAAIDSLPVPFSDAQVLALDAFPHGAVGGDPMVIRFELPVTLLPRNLQVVRLLPAWLTSGYLHERVVTATTTIKHPTLMAYKAGSEDGMYAVLKTIMPRIFDQLQLQYHIVSMDMIAMLADIKYWPSVSNDKRNTQALHELLVTVQNNTTRLRMTPTSADQTNQTLSRLLTQHSR